MKESPDAEVNYKSNKQYNHISFCLEPFAHDYIHKDRLIHVKINLIFCFASQWSAKCYFSVAVLYPTIFADASAGTVTVP